MYKLQFIALGSSSRTEPGFGSLCSEKDLKLNYLESRLRSDESLFNHHCFQCLMFAALVPQLVYEMNQWRSGPKGPNLDWARTILSVTSWWTPSASNPPWRSHWNQEALICEISRSRREGVIHQNQNQTGNQLPSVYLIKRHLLWCFRRWRLGNRTR